MIDKWKNDGRPEHTHTPYVKGFEKRIKMLAFIITPQFHIFKVYF